MDKRTVGSVDGRKDASKCGGPADQRKGLNSKTPFLFYMHICEHIIVFYFCSCRILNLHV